MTFGRDSPVPVQTLNKNQPSHGRASASQGYRTPLPPPRRALAEYINIRFYNNVHKTSLPRRR